ncbi:dTDP-4-amino-4,6-dideoxygalactose transaminase [Agreia sp. VKM Ac-1783]|uniref:dTDP-4-amino-4,6-dideoxygalactose transaminase n=1 Tax=Agreia sp. VKM Ac-1783 TaxID=1938889 RepID=UPI000A2AC709|nr:dTDP-4-amino-4,6-dideoxygalactose transaminase [Agreia sp. VKM Ac-1783]SMQ60490.1 dTDP-4-amino-4,6-dideoxygalactose transaminase [Agreia sp. VKM Ac-1783]
MRHSDDVVFSRPFLSPAEIPNLTAVSMSSHAHGDGPFTASATARLTALTGAPNVLLTSSGTHALEMASRLLDLGPGDEVILPSFTFPSAATAVATTGATCVFVDIDPASGNIDVAQVDEAIGPRTRAISVMSYGGVAVDFDALHEITRRTGLSLIEDNAHGLGGYLRDRPLGSFGRLAMQSFHDTKNVHSGEGGALLVNDAELFQRAEIIREKGTNRSRFLRGEVDKYTWVDEGSSYLMSEYGAAVLDSQLQSFAEIQTRRFAVWNAYAEHLADWADAQGVTLMRVPDDRTHTAHLFYLRMPTHGEQVRMLSHLRSLGVVGTFHYVPLDTAPAGLRFGRTLRPLTQSKAFSEEIVRLPLWAGMTDGQVERVLAAVQSFVVEPQSLLTAVENPRDEVRAG